MPNYNPATGTPYGVISVNSLPSWIWDEIDNMECPEEREDFNDYIVQVAYELAKEGRLTVEDFDGSESDLPIEERIADTDPTILGCLCENAGRNPGDEWEPDMSAYRRHGVIDGVTVSVAELGGALNLWVEDSPYTGYYRQTSPCIPGAGDCDSPCDPDDYGAVLCYMPPPAWREEAEKEEAENEAWIKASGLHQ